MNIRFTTRLTNKLKRTYKISLNGDACWCGTCPDCGEVWTANNVNITQATIVRIIESHRVDVHDWKGYDT